MDGLGKALLLLSTCNIKALLKSSTKKLPNRPLLFKNEDGGFQADNSVPSATTLLLSFIDQCAEGSNSEELVGRFVILPLLEGKNEASAVIWWLLCYNSCQIAHLASKGLLYVLPLFKDSKKNKCLPLKVVRVLSRIFVVEIQKVQKRIHDLESNALDSSTVINLIEAIMPLSIEKGNPTVLNAEAADTVIMGISLITRDGTSTEKVCRINHFLREMVLRFETWYLERYPIYSASLACISTLCATQDEFLKSILKNFLKWKDFLYSRIRSRKKASTLIPDIVYNLDDAEDIPSSIICLGLVTGRYSNQDCKKLLRDVGGNYGREIATKLFLVFSAKSIALNENVEHLILMLLPQILIAAGDTSAVLLDILHMVKEEGRGINLLSDIASKLLCIEPSLNVVSALTDILVSSDHVKNCGALDILSHIVSTSPESIGASCQEMLASRLKMLLRDRVQSVRTKSVGLLGKLEPTITVRKLIESMLSHNQEEQSAANVAIMLILNRPDSEPEDILSLFVDALAKESDNITPSHPGDIGCETVKKTSQSPQRGASKIERVLKILEEWTKTESLHIVRWKSVANFLLELVLKDPGNHIKVKIAKATLPGLAKYKSVLILILERIISVSYHQPRLTEEMLAPDFPSKAVGLVLLQRLAPLVLLHLLPSTAFTIDTLKDYLPSLYASPWTLILYHLGLDEGQCRKIQKINIDIISVVRTTCNDGADDRAMQLQMLSLLTERTMARYEFAEVRRMACGLYAKLFPSYIVVPPLLVSLEFSINVDPEVSGWVIYSLCQIFASKKCYNNENIFKVLPGIINCIGRVLLRTYNNEDLEKLRRGCVECLGFLISGCLSAGVGDGFCEKFSSSILKEKPCKSTSIIDTSEVLIRNINRILTQNGKENGVELNLENALTDSKNSSLGLSMISALAHAANLFHSSKDELRSAKASISLFQQVVQPLMDLISNSGINTHLKAASLHVLFLLGSENVKDIFKQTTAGGMARICRSILTSGAGKDRILHLCALKLLSGVLLKVRDKNLRDDMLRLLREYEPVALGDARSLAISILSTVDDSYN